MGASTYFREARLRKQQPSLKSKCPFLSIDRHTKHKRHKSPLAIAIGPFVSNRTETGFLDFQRRALGVEVILACESLHRYHAGLCNRGAIREMR